MQTSASCRSASDGSPRSARYWSPPAPVPPRAARSTRAASSAALTGQTGDAATRSRTPHAQTAAQACAPGHARPAGRRRATGAAPVPRHSRRARSAPRHARQPYQRQPRRTLLPCQPSPADQPAQVVVALLGARQQHQWRPSTSVNSAPITGWIPALPAGGVETHHAIEPVVIGQRQAGHPRARARATSASGADAPSSRL